MTTKDSLHDLESGTKSIGAVALAHALHHGRFAFDTKKGGDAHFGCVFFLILSGGQAPHVRPVGRTCGEPDEIELAAMGVELNGSRTRCTTSGSPSTPTSPTTSPACTVRGVGRSIPPRWRSIRARPHTCTYAPWGVCV